MTMNIIPGKPIEPRRRAPSTGVGSDATSVAAGSVRAFVAMVLTLPTRGLEGSSSQSAMFVGTCERVDLAVIASAFRERPSATPPGFRRVAEACGLTI